MVKVYFALLLLTLLVVAGCGPAPVAPAGPTATNPTPVAAKPTPATSPVPNPATITVAELNAMLANKDFILIDVHIPYAGEIPGTDARIPYNEIEKQAGQLPRDRTAKIVVYCRSGSMSAIASKTLVDMGYTNVFDVQGGMDAWQGAGYTLLNKPE